MSTTKASTTHTLQNGGVPVITGTPAVTATVDSNTKTAKLTIIESVTQKEVKPVVVSDTNKTETKNPIQPTVQICTEDNKKIIISGARSVQDIPVSVLQQILNNVKNVKPNEAVLVINHNKNSAQGTEKKSYESIVEDALRADSELESAPFNDATENRNDVTTIDPLQNDSILIQKQNRTDCVPTNKLNIGDSDTKIKIYGFGKNVDKNDKDKLSNVQLTTKSIPKSSVAQSPKCALRQKKFLYRLKSKNGRVLSYVSETPIVLKKPVIRLDKMTQADAERLSRQFAAEKKRNTRKKSHLSNSSVDQKETDVSSASQQSYGVQTRKRQLKFLPDGRIVKDRKSKRLESSSSSLSSLDDDDLDKPVVTSDEDYNESLDLPTMSSDEDVKVISDKSASSKKVTPPKKVAVEKNHSYDYKGGIRNNSNAFADKLNNSKTFISSGNAQPSETPNIKPVQKKLSVDPATVFTSLLKIPILSSQLNIRRYKPKYQSPQVNKSNSFNCKKILTLDVKNQSNSVSNANVRGNTSVSNSFTVPKNAGNTTGLKPLSSLPKRDTWSLKNVPRRNEYETTSIDPPPLAPLSQKVTPALKSINQSTFKKTASAADNIHNQTTSDAASKFDGFSNTKIVKTKAGPKKAKLEELKRAEEPRTIYEMMEEIFDSMPHWNIHVIPENKSYCLAQVSLGRTGIPTLKKSIEINSEFMVKVYVHQLHCRRYDGIYDTESKLRKLIHDVDSIVS